MKILLAALLVLCACPLWADNYPVLQSGVEVSGSPDMIADRAGSGGETTVMARYTFDIDTGRAATALISGAGVMNQYIVLSGPGGFRAESDSRLLPTPVRVASGRVSAAGRYYCTVYSSSSSTRDTFTLNLQVSDSEILLFKVSDFAFGDHTFANGAYFERYTVPVQAGDRLQIDMMGGAVDCFLHAGYEYSPMIVRPIDPAEVWENDNAEPGTANSRLILTAPKTGTLAIIATHAPLPQRRSTPGGYILSVERAPAAPAEPIPRVGREREEEDPEGRMPD